MHRALRFIALAATLALSACDADIAWQPLDPSLFAGAPVTHALPFDDQEHEALDHDRINASTSSALADAFVHIPYALIFAFAAFFTWQHGRRARMERASNPTAPLVDGPSVVFGAVEHDPQWNGPVVRLDIHQKGTEWANKGAWHHQWRETHRVLYQRPFVVVRDDGLRVQVEPGPQVAVHDTPDIVRHSRDQRTRVAAIEVAQRVHVSGALVGASLAQAAAGGAYRSGFGAPVLRPPSMGRMIISNERPGDTSAARQRFHRGWAIAMAVLYAFALGVVMPAYQLLSLTGDTVWATPTAVSNWREWHKPKNSSGYWVYKWSVRGVYNDHGTQRTVDDECGEAYYRCVTSGACAQVPFTVSWIAPSWHQIGGDAQLTIGRAICLGILCLLILLVYPISVVSGRPWYMKKRVVDGGNGRLEASHP